MNHPSRARCTLLDASVVTLGSNIGDVSLLVAYRGFTAVEDVVAGECAPWWLFY